MGKFLYSVAYSRSSDHKPTLVIFQGPEYVFVNSMYNIAR